jgi:O-antigen ligase
MALAAAIIGTHLEVGRLLDIVVAVLFTLVLGSAVVSLALPDAGTMLAAGKMVWRGMFTHKNELGQISGLALLLGFYVGRERHSRLAWLTAALAAVCLVMSDSKGGLSSAAAALMMSWLIKAMGRKLSPALTIVLLLALIAQAVILFIYGLPLLLQALDRDPTLTGRTIIWDLYVQSASQSPWLGAGPGAYTNHVVPNELTYPLVLKLLQFGLILTPHNLFIGVFGDTGLFGLSAFVLTLLWLAIATPLYRANTAGHLCSAVALLIIFNGLIETGLPFGPSVTAFTLVLFFATAQRRTSPSPENAPADQRRPPGPLAKPA